MQEFGQSDLTIIFQRLWKILANLRLLQLRQIRALQTWTPSNLIIYCSLIKNKLISFST